MTFIKRSILYLFIFSMPYIITLLGNVSGLTVLFHWSFYSYVIFYFVGRVNSYSYFLFNIYLHIIFFQIYFRIILLNLPPAPPYNLVAFWFKENLCSFNINPHCCRTLKNVKFQTDFIMATWTWISRGYNSIIHLNEL